MAKKGFFFSFLIIFLFPLISSISLTNTNIISSGLNSSIFVDNLILDELIVSNTSIDFIGITYPCNIFSLSFTSLNKSISLSDIVNCSESTSTSTGGSYPVYNPTQKQLQEGYEISLQKNGEVQFSFNNENHTIKLDNIANGTATITVSSNPITFTLIANETKKIDLNNDNSYDLQIFLKSIDVYNADLVIKIIHEEIPAKAIELETSDKLQLLAPLLVALIIFILIIILILIGFRKQVKKVKKKIYF